jgi:hypothetical protein
MVKHVLAKEHIPKLNELTELEVSELTITTVDETALSILKRQGSRGIETVRLQRKSIFDSLAVPILTLLTDKTL